MKFKCIINKIYKLWNLQGKKIGNIRTRVKNTFTLCTALKLLPSNKICREIVR